MHRVTDASGFTELSAPASKNAGGATVVLCQFDQMAGKPAEHGSLIFAEEAIQQYVEFFETGSVKAPY